MPISTSCLESIGFCTIILGNCIAGFKGKKVDEKWQQRRNLQVVIKIGDVYIFCLSLIEVVETNTKKQKSNSGIFYRLFL